LLKILNKLVHSEFVLFTFFASCASIISLFGWAAETFLDFAPKTLGVVSVSVIGCLFFFALSLFVRAFILYKRINNLNGDYVLSHRITHNLRNAITALQDLEFDTLSKIEKTEIEQEFLPLKENDELKRKSLFEKLGAKVTGAVAKQVKNYFICDGLEGNIRVTIKSIIPKGNSQLDWGIKTVVVDPNTWNNEDRIIEEHEDKLHIIGENSDFEEILLGNTRCFVENNLSNLSGSEYKNSSQDWRKRYNATMVVPIKNKPDGKENTVYYGFLTIDSNNEKAQKLFDDSQDSATLNILAHAADALAVWFIKNDNHTVKLTGAFTERMGIIELNNMLKNYIK
jgi:hypothetical protein